MKIIVNKKTSETEIRKAIEEMQKQGKKAKAMDTKLFFGKMTWNEDPLVFQNKLRDEWN